MNFNGIGIGRPDRKISGLTQSIVFRATTFAFALASVLLSAEARAQERVALVIGNGSYRNVASLANPTNDAGDVAAALGRLGFSVNKIENADFDAMRRALLDFNRRARGADMAVVFFAGHGIEVGGENWLIPVDAELRSDIDAEQEAIGLKSIMLSISGASRLGLVMLDACRNNPFVAKMQRTARVRAVERGLARVEPSGNVLVAYASKDGSTAKDGTGRNSPFTTALLKHLETPGLEVTFLFRHVHDDVMAATTHEQEPYVYGALSKEPVYLKAALSPPSAGTPTASPPVPPNPAPPHPPKITAPREPLPADIPIDPALLRLVETHPFFANAPPVVAGSHNVDGVLSWTSNGATETTTSNAETTIRWLRQGIVRSNSVDQSAGSFSAFNLRTTSRTTHVMAANGLIGLGLKQVISQVSTTGNGRGSPSTSTVTSKAVRIDDMKGQVFPMAVGNRLSYDVTQQMTSEHSNAPKMIDEITWKNSCEVTRKLEARSFHPKLTGAAYVLTCDVQSVWKKNKASDSNSQSKDMFFENLGIWVSADPVSPREQIVRNDGTYNGTYTLKSFTLVPQ